MPRVSFSPKPALAEPLLSVELAEGMLAEWFGRPVVLTSSGRAALLLCLRHLGLNRYDSRLAMAPRTAQCVFDAVTRAAFPVDPANDMAPVDATLIVHQYGYMQKPGVSGLVIEDVCHAFFSGTQTGDRDWLGSLAVFSLPKFFGLSGMCGGVIAADQTVADALRDLRDAVPEPDADELAQDQSTWRSGSSSALEHIYLRALLNPRCSPGAVGGLPQTVAALGETGAARHAVTECLLDAIPQTVLNSEWRAMCQTRLPYALPIFGEAARLQPIADRIQSIGIETGLFRVDLKRNLHNPEFRTALLVPCHHAMSRDDLDGLCHILREGLAG